MIVVINNLFIQKVEKFWFSSSDYFCTCAIEYFDKFSFVHFNSLRNQTSIFISKKFQNLRIFDSESDILRIKILKISRNSTLNMKLEDSQIAWGIFWQAIHRNTTILFFISQMIINYFIEKTCFVIEKIHIR